MTDFGSALLWLGKSKIAASFADITIQNLGI
jgi:hypothetical protein